jgi:hypothetical protein
MNLFIRYIFLSAGLSLVLPSCVSSKKAATFPNTDFLRENAGEIETLVKDCLLFGRDNGVTFFDIDSLTNTTTKKKLSSYAASVQIVYSSNYAGAFTFDSTVVFTRITLAGVREVIFDFAEKTKELDVYFTSRRNPYLIKVTDRIYYRRRPFPMM